MNNWEKDIKTNTHSIFSNIYHGNVPHDIFEWINNVIWDKRRIAKLSAAKHLAGHISEEYFIKNRDKDFVPDDNFIRYQNYIGKCCCTKPLTDLWANNQYLTENCNLVIDTSWANFQKKYEFNPPHIHSGLFSWIIFVKIPYDLKNEENYFLSDHLTQASK